MTPRRRLSIAGLMALTAAAGLNLAAARWLVRSDVEWLGLVMPMTVSLELALFGLLWSRGQRRRFWAGYIVGGVPALASLCLAGWRDESALYHAWDAALEATEWLIFVRLAAPRPASFLLVETVAAFAPLVGLGVLAGVVAVLIGRCAWPRPAPSNRAPGRPPL